MARFDFDLFTIGAGSGGVAGSRRANSGSRLSARFALSRLIGSDAASRFSR